MGSRFCNLKLHVWIAFPFHVNTSHSSLYLQYPTCILLHSTWAWQPAIFLPTKGDRQKMSRITGIMIHQEWTASCRLSPVYISVGSASDWETPHEPSYMETFWNQASINKAKEKGWDPCFSNELPKIRWASTVTRATVLLKASSSFNQMDKQNQPLVSDVEEKSQPDGERIMPEKKCLPNFRYYPLIRR